jgi:hypothetical protein
LIIINKLINKCLFFSFIILLSYAAQAAGIKIRMHGKSLIECMLVGEEIMQGVEGGLRGMNVCVCGGQVGEKRKPKVMK